MGVAISVNLTRLARMSDQEVVEVLGGVSYRPCGQIVRRCGRAGIVATIGNKVVIGCSRYKGGDGGP